MTIDKETLQWIANHGKGVSFAIPNDEEVALIPPGFSVSLPPADPLPDTLRVDTLGALAHYVNENRDGLALEDLIIVVESPCQAYVRGKIEGRHRHRPAYLCAASSDGHPEIVSGSWVPIEEAIEELLACFDPTDDRDELVAVLSRAKTTSEIQQVDDGFHQTITTEQGKVTLGRDKLPSPALLAPRLSFSGEVGTAEHPYIVRVRSGGAGVAIKLLEADGGAWRLAQKGAVAGVIADLLTEDIPVLY